MNRRNFLGLLGAGAAGFALDPERLLWRPGQRTFFLPTTPMLQVGDFVVYEFKERVLFGGSIPGNTYAFPDVATLLHAGSKGPVGIVTQVYPLVVQTGGVAYARVDGKSGWADYVMLSDPWTAGHEVVGAVASLIG